MEAYNCYRLYSLPIDTQFLTVETFCPSGFHKHEGFPSWVGQLFPEGGKKVGCLKYPTTSGRLAARFPGEGPSVIVKQTQRS